VVSIIGQIIRQKKTRPIISLWQSSKRFHKSKPFLVILQIRLGNH